MINNNMTDIDYLRKLYIDHLSEIVNYGQNDRPRVAYPGKWKKLPNIVSLSEGVNEPLHLPSLNGDRKVWVWSDLHFFHKNIIDFSARPYEDVTQMNEHLIANYNEYVGENDVCIWVGDVGFGSTTEINKLLSQCKGYKILVVGNHDFNGKKLRVLDFDETHLIYMLDYPDISLVFTHYPMYNIHSPWVNVHGHLHVYPCPDTENPLHINVNCEVQGYRPRPLDEIIELAKFRLIST